MSKFLLTINPDVCLGTMSGWSKLKIYLHRLRLTRGGGIVAKLNIILCMVFSSSFCLFGVFHPTWEIFTHGDDTITDEGLQILIYSGHSWPLSTEGSLACQPYCDMGHPFVMSFPRMSDTCICCQAFDSGLLWPGSEPRIPTCRWTL